MGTTPQVIATPKTWAGVVSAANTNRDGTGTVVTLVTAGTNGSRIDRVRACAAVTTTAGVVRLFVYNGTTYYLLRELMVQAVTPSASVEAWRDEVRFDEPLILPSGYSLRCSVHNAEAINVFAHGGDF